MQFISLVKLYNISRSREILEQNIQHLLNVLVQMKKPGNFKQGAENKGYEREREKKKEREQKSQEYTQKTHYKAL